MKRILILNYEFPPLGGGAGNALYYLLKEFSKFSDLEIDVVTSSADSYQEQKFAASINIYCLDIGKKNNLHFQTLKDLLTYSYKAYTFSKRLIKEKKYDIVHAFFGIPCGYIAMKLGLPYIVSLRGSDVPFYNKRFVLLDRLFFRNLSKKIWQHARCVIANSSGLKELALKTAPEQEVRIIANGIDTVEFKPANSLDDKFFTVISTSRLIERKGVESLLKAFIRLHRKYHDARLLLVGDGNLRSQLERLVNDNGVANAVTFYGRLPHHSLPEIYNQADVFILASMNEGMSNSLLEAMSSGLAVIVSNTGGVVELLKDNGVILGKVRAEELFAALEDLYLNRKKLSTMKKNSRQVVLNGFSWKQVANEYFSVYKVI